MILGYSHIITSSPDGISMPIGISLKGYKLAFTSENIYNPNEKSLFLKRDQKRHSIYFYTSGSNPAVEVVVYDIMDTYISKVTFEGNQISIPSRLPERDLFAVGKLLNISQSGDFINFFDIQTPFKVIL